MVLLSEGYIKAGIGRDLNVLREIGIKTIMCTGDNHLQQRLLSDECEQFMQSLNRKDKKPLKKSRQREKS